MYMNMNFSYNTDVKYIQNYVRCPDKVVIKYMTSKQVWVMLGSHGSRLHVITADTNEQLSKKPKIFTEDEYSKWIKKIPEACTKAKLPFSREKKQLCEKLKL